MAKLNIGQVLLAVPLAPINIVTDRKIEHCDAGDLSYYVAHSLCRRGGMVSVTVPIMLGYPFGMFPKATNLRFGSFSNAALAVEIKKRSWSVSSYRYGFNGQERDNEVSGEGNSYTAEYWQYDSRLGRRWNVDPVNKPWESSYACFRNKPILLTDINGDDVDLDNLSEKDREKVLSYTDKESKNYNEEFANLYNLLDSDKNTVYQFNNTNIDASNPNEAKAFGHVGYEGKNESGQDIISINYTMNLSGIWAKETALFEETFHADQFRRGEFGFSQQDDGTWNTVGLEIYDEIEAKVWTHSNVNNGKPLGQNLNEYKKYKRNKEEYKAYLLKNPTYKNIYDEQENFIKALSRETKYPEEDIKSWFDEKGVIMSNNKAGRMPTN